MSTNISFFMFFLSVICDIGRCIAVDAIVLDDKIDGVQVLAGAFCYMRMGSLTMNCFMFSVVMNCG